MSINKYLFGSAKTKLSATPRRLNRTKQMKRRYSSIKDARSDAQSYANVVFKEYPSLTDEQKKNMINYFTVVGKASEINKSKNLEAAIEEFRSLVQEASSARILETDISTLNTAYQAILDSQKIIDDWLTRGASMGRQEQVWGLPETSLGY